jgi:hypothetical protein
MLTIFKHSHPVLKTIPGPLSLAVLPEEGVIWAAGGGRGFSAVFRFTEERGWTSMQIDAHGLRDVLPLSAESALVVGEHGFAAVIHVARETRIFHTRTRDCLFTLGRDADGKFWAAGDNGTLLQLWVAANLECELTPSGTKERIVQLDFTACASGGKRVMLAGNQLIYGSRVVLMGSAPLTRLAQSKNGYCVVGGDAGQLYAGAQIEALASCDVTALNAQDIESVAYDPATSSFVVGAKNSVGQLKIGSTQVSVMGKLDDTGAVTQLTPWKNGVLGSAWIQTGAPYRFLGTVFFMGANDEAPTQILNPIRQEIPERRERTVGITSTEFLNENDGQMISIDEAKRRMPTKIWPDTQHTQVRYFAGSVRVTNASQLLSETNEVGFAVVINGDLIVDGYLHGGAGGDGFDSILVVSKNVWAESAYFGSCITVVCQLLEVATVIMCAYGDNGGSLWIDSMRAQVFHYATYFSKPECVIDAFCVGDVYGDRSFPPDRGAEIFVSEVLADGVLNEHTAQRFLKKGDSIIRAF